MMDPQVRTRFDEIVTQVRVYHPGLDVDLFDRAFRFADEKHEGQTRKSGEPYIAHPVEVAAITADMHLDPYSLCAALLHDTVEDTEASIEEIHDVFGAEVALLVSGLTKINKLQFKSREVAQAENIRKLVVAMSRDLRVILVKLADRLHNMRTLEHMSSSGQKRIARETIDIYAPLANRLGINWIKTELEDQSFRYLHPEDYQEIKEKVSKTRSEREAYIHEVNNELLRIVKEAGLNAEIHGRPKHFYSIYKKLSSREFEELYDLTAFRIIVDTTPACYEALGLVHATWKPVAGRFKDYIAMPKFNLYQLVAHDGDRAPR